MPIDLGSRVFFKASEADGGAVSVALVTNTTGETLVDLAVKPNQLPWFDAAGVELLNNQAEGAACWSPWPLT